LLALEKEESGNGMSYGGKQLGEKSQTKNHLTGKEERKPSLTNPGSVVGVTLPRGTSNITFTSERRLGKGRKMEENITYANEDSEKRRARAGFTDCT